MNGARYEALFASGLQPADAPTAEMIAEAIESTVRRFGVRGCAGRMAQEFGELYLCRHSANELWPALSAQGWTIWRIDEYALPPQTS